VSTGYLIDTNILSELARARPDEQVIAWLRENEQALYVSSITIGELRRGIETLAAGKRKTDLQTWLVSICKRMDGRVLSFNTSTAHVWGQLVSAWEKKGITVPSLDSQIAAIAHRHSLTIVTRNTSDFQHTGIKLLNPFSV